MKGTVVGTARSLEVFKYNHPPQPLCDDRPRAAVACYHRARVRVCGARTTEVIPRLRAAPVIVIVAFGGGY